MKIRILTISLALFITSFINKPGAVYAQTSSTPGPEPYHGLPLCLPGIYLNTPQDCIPAGPSKFLTEMARKGITFPPMPLPVSSPDPSLNLVSVNYAKINVESSEPVAIYASVQDASSGTNPARFIPAGAIRYVSFTQQISVESRHFVQLSSGEWMRASPASISVFQGLLFRSNPKMSFGWIVEGAHPRTGPGYNYPELEKLLPREKVVQIHQVQQDNQTLWYMIAINEWVERRYIRQVQVLADPPAGVDNNRWIEINLFEQTVSVYENGRILFSTLIASGVDPFYTQPGLFQIYEKKPYETMTGAFEADKSDYYYLEDVPWTMYFDKARALHGAYWRTMFGYPQSHGCINLSIGDSRWLYDWAQVGDWVYVWDPSGETPTDPAFYGEGGA